MHHSSSLHTWALAALCSLVCLTRARGQAGLECAASGSCSVGHSRPWSGDVSASAALQEMLSAVSHKNELIITSLSQDGPAASAMDMVAQQRYELLRMGLAHFVVLALTQQQCEAIQKVVPDISCVWSSPTGPSIGTGAQQLSLAKWRLLARATRLGYNVLSVDPELIITRDPYLHLKRAPLSQHQMICLGASDGLLDCERGMLYVQNALPEGPVSWVLRSVVDTVTWVLDDEGQIVVKAGSSLDCVADDRVLLRDALSSALVGRPLQPSAFKACKPSFTGHSHDGVPFSHQDVTQTIELALSERNDRISRTEVPPPHDWMQPSVPMRTSDYMATYVNLTVPNLAYGWPEELGGRLGPEPRASESAAWHALLRSDCPACVWWHEQRPTPEEAISVLSSHTSDTQDTQQSQQQVSQETQEVLRDLDVPQESLLLAPLWLVAPLLQSRRGAVLGYNAPVPSAPVMLYTHHTQPEDGADTQPQHTVLQVRKIFGRYNWELGTQVARAYNRPGPYQTATQVTKVVALHPGIDLTRTRSVSEYNAIITGLLQVALLSKRMAVLPDLPCGTLWAHRISGGGGDSLSQLNGTHCASLVQHAALRESQGPGDTRSLQAIPFVWDDEGLSPMGSWRPEQLTTATPDLLTVPINADLQQSAARRSLRASVHARRLLQQAGEERPTEVDSVAQDAQAKALAEQAEVPGSQSGQSSSSESGSAAELPAEDWWMSRQYRLQLPYQYDDTCLSGVGALLSMDLHHWLSLDPDSAAARVTPDTSNTLFVPGMSELSLLPHSDPEKRMTQAQWMETPGWSLADVQAALPVARVVSELSRVSEEPLVYLGHPVAVLAGKEWYRRAAEASREGESPDSSSSSGEARSARREALNRPQAQLGSETPQHSFAASSNADSTAPPDEEDPHSGAASSLSDAALGNGPVNYSALLQEANEQLMSSQCRLVWEDPTRATPNSAGAQSGSNTDSEAPAYVLDFSQATLAALKSQVLVRHRRRMPGDLRTGSSGYRGRHLLRGAHQTGAH